jgi:diguanylate cyclase (GGDEF)-like protein/hemerythrin-like metal-binding protein
MAELLVSQLDYVYFFFGLVLFLLAAVCFSMSRAGSLPTPWWILGLFAAAHGVSQWLHLLALASADTPGFAGARAAWTGLSFLFLLEFARRTNRILHGRTVGPWIHLPLVLTVLVLVRFFGTSTLDSAVRLAIGLPAAIWTFLLFLAAANRTEELGGGPRALRARLWGAFYFGAFAIASGLVVPPAPFVPAGWPSPAGCLALLGVPIQLVRALLVCGMALSVWALAVSFDPRGRLLRKRRILFWAMAGSIAGIVGAGWVFTDRLGKLNDRVLVDDAQSAASQIQDHLVMEMESADVGARSLSEIVGRFHAGPAGIDRSRLGEVVDALSHGSKEGVVYVLDPEGTTVSASNRDRPESFVGKSYAVRPYFRAAMEGRPGRFIGMGLTSSLPGYYASMPIRDAAGRIVGVAVEKRNLDESQLGPASGLLSYVVAPDGRVLVAGGGGRRDRPLWPSGAAAIGDQKDRAVLDHPFEGEAWFVLEGERTIAVRRPIPGFDWSLVVLKRERTHVANRLLGIVITLLLCAVVLTYFVAMQRQLGAESHITVKRHEAEVRARDLARQADTDALTGVLNRHGFNTMISRELARARRHTQPLAVVILDIDHFKQVNDRHGHAAGDQVLEGLARILESHVRESDLVARWGGEEFVVIAPMTGIDGAANLAEKIRALLESTDLGPEGPVTASFGVAELKPDDTVEALLHRADEALYRAKTGGRNRVERGDASPVESPDAAVAEGRTEEQMVPRKQLYSETGYEPIDREHKDLSDALEAFIGKVNAGKVAEVESAMDALIAGVGAHFAHEERLMVEFDYPQAKRHAEAHALFVGDVLRFQKELQQGGVTATFRRWAVSRLLEWFRFHILSHDIGLGQFLRKAGVPAKPPASI